MRHDNIINALEVRCPFPEVFEEEETPKNYGTRYRRKIAHIRADYDGRRWWNTIWLCHDGLATPEIRREIDAVYHTLISEDVFVDLGALRSFCTEFPQALANATATDEYNFYMESVFCGYWLRCITRDKDYNLYLHAFLISDLPHQKYFNFLDELEAQYPAGNTLFRMACLQENFPELIEGEAATFAFRWERRFKATGGAENEYSAH